MASATPATPATTEDRPKPGIRTLQVIVVAVLMGFVAMLAGADTLIPFAGWYLVSSLIPAAAIVAYRPGRWIVAVGLVAVVVPLALLTVDRLDPDADGFDRAHDGGVVATRAAAEMALDGTNPYTADFTEPLRPDHHRLAEGDPAEQANPLVEHYPYLPGAFLVQVPVVAVADLFGADGDPRWLYGLCFAAVVALVLRAERPAWARGAALWVLGANAAVAVYLPWGANDAAAASLVVLGAHTLRRRPVVAGLLVAAAVSLKALLVVALLPLVLVALAWSKRPEDGAGEQPADGELPSTQETAGRAVLWRFLGAFTGTLVVTCLPYFLASPGDFFEDTVDFNLGRTDLTYPTSGIGLAATYPDVVTDGVMLLLSVALLALAGVVGVRALRRRPTPAVALLATAGFVLAGLIPARTFQVSYLPLPVVLAATVWLDAGRSGGRRRDRSAGVGRASHPDGAATAVPSGNL